MNQMTSNNLSTSYNDARVKLTVSGDATLTLKGVSDPDVRLVSEYIGTPLPEYRGTYRVTPTADGQVLPTKGTRVSADIIIDPVPENYGLITWNGSTLTVS